ncbi:flagellar FliJ family protein [Desulfurella sp.]|uniref:flagellar FliJ family protein n=1 Tax=Desulfurella sp. TaxID=1962857 RepID=UPI003D0E5EAD
MFAFKLEKIKNLKENLMNIEIIKLNNINNQIKQKTLLISELNNQIKSLYKRFDDHIKTNIDFNVLKYIADGVLALEYEIKTTQKDLEELKAKKESQIKIIKNIHKEIKKFEKLKEHYKERYIYEEKLKEQNFINDISSIFYTRNK